MILQPIMDTGILIEHPELVLSTRTATITLKCDEKKQLLFIICYIKLIFIRKQKITVVQKSKNIMFNKFQTREQLLHFKKRQKVHLLGRSIYVHRRKNNNLIDHWKCVSVLNLFIATLFCEFVQREDCERVDK